MSEREHPGPRPRDDTDAVQDIARDLAEVAAEIATFKGEANAYLGDPKYNPSGSGWRMPTPRSRRPPWRHGAGCDSTRDGSGERSRSGVRSAPVVVAEDIRGMSIDTWHMRDPHVVALRYHIEHSEELTSGDNPPPIERETAAFRMRLADGVATFQMKEHHSSEDSARQVVDEYLRPWEISADKRSRRR